MLGELLGAEKPAQGSPVLPLDDIESPIKQASSAAWPADPSARLGSPPGERVGSTRPITPVQLPPVRGEFDESPLSAISREAQPPVARGPQPETISPLRSSPAPTNDRPELAADPPRHPVAPAEKDAQAEAVGSDHSAPIDSEEPGEQAAAGTHKDWFGIADLNKLSSPLSTPVGAAATEGSVARPDTLAGRELASGAGAATDAAPPKPPAAADVAAADPLAAFLEGAGLPATIVEGRSPEAFLRDAGQVLASLADGLRELLAVRAAVKEHARLDRTQIAAAANNPLKLSVNRRQATTALLGRGEEGFLPPLATVRASFRDLKAHELAMLEGLQSAADELLEAFEPAVLERKLPDAGALAVLLQGGRRARLWELYQERYDEIARSARTHFLGHAGEAFRQAFARKAGEVSAHGGPPAGATP